VVDLPGLLTGALAVQLGQDLAFGTAGLGAAIAAVRATATVSSVPVGRFADRLGAINALRVATAAAALSAAWIALGARSWWGLTAGLIVSGFAIAMGHPAANRLLSRTVPPDRQGIAFGIKQSAPPTASLLAGVSVPMIALTVGWRWAFGLGAVLAVVMMVAIGRRPAQRPKPLEPPAGGRRRRPRPGMVVLGFGFGFGTAAAVVVPAFYVDTAVRAGSPVSLAGTLLAVASAATIVVRVSMGFVADRIERNHFWLCGGLLAVGCVGLVLLASGNPMTMAAGVVVATPMLWGFNGVFWFAVVRLGSDRPGTITGIMSPGGHLGGSLGPLTFGLLATAVGDRGAWLTWSLLGLAAALSMFAAAHVLGRSTAPTGSAQP
jgi:MFS family permease